MVRTVDFELLLSDGTMVSSDHVFRGRRPAEAYAQLVILASSQPDAAAVDRSDASVNLQGNHYAAVRLYVVAAHSDDVPAVDRAAAAAAQDCVGEYGSWFGRKAQCCRGGGRWRRP